MGSGQTGLQVGARRAGWIRIHNKAAICRYEVASPDLTQAPWVRN